MNNQPSATNPCQEPECNATHTPEQNQLSAREERLKTLAACMKESFGAAAFLKYIRSIAVNLEALHKKGDICLNVCPDNIVCREDETAFLSPDCPTNRKEAFLHTDRTTWNLPENKDYAPPEVILFKGGYFDRRLMVCWGHRADIYSLGLILCQALFGSCTLTKGERQRILELLRAQLRRENLSAPWQDIPEAALEELRLLLKKMLTKLCADRLDTMEEVVYGIGAVLAKLDHSSGSIPAM